MEENNKLMLIDGHSILNRAYFGLPHLTAPDGTPTGAVYGFLNIMFKFLDDEDDTSYITPVRFQNPFGTCWGSVPRPHLPR